MGIIFGIPIVSKIDIDADKARLKLYFKHQINNKSSEPSYSFASLFADIGGYFGLFLGELVHLSC